MDFAEISLFFFLFAFIGVAHEVIWTSLVEYAKSRKMSLKGGSSLWMFPIYGSIFFIVLLVLEHFPGFPWWIRGFIYMVLIYIWEFASGWTVRWMIGVAPWDYSAKKYNLSGLINLDYAPIWFIEGLIAEWRYLFLQSHLVL